MSRRPPGQGVSLPIVDEVIALWRGGIAYIEIAKRVGVSKVTVYRILLKSGVQLKPKNWRGVKCVECGKVTSGKKRCPLHLRLRLAELNRGYQRKRNKVPETRYRTEEWNDRQPARSIGVRWRKEQSGRGGPLVMQLQTRRIE